ncbi:hypothetical protein [Bacillus cereus]|uniref:hypothetical protein n=1 Tax=Bacillus cereus TaxID=1396 RepID=UPI000BEBE335|nr:hypothetical protein [Bacillus cereus]PEF61521.1 hypothetical protein CON35_24800 [Bacillus cereus]
MELEPGLRNYLLIRIDTSSIVPLQDAGDIQIDYNTTIQDEQANGHPIQVDGIGTTQMAGGTFVFTQFHFHAPVNIL